MPITLTTAAPVPEPFKPVAAVSSENSSTMARKVTTPAKMAPHDTLCTRPSRALPSALSFQDTSVVPVVAWLPVSSARCTVPTVEVGSPVAEEPLVYCDIEKISLSGVVAGGASGW